MNVVEINKYCENGAFKNAFNAAHQLNPKGGTCLEFGIGMGRTYSWQVMRILNDFPDSRLVGFDAFKGLPDESADVWCPEHHSKGKLCWSAPEVYQAFNRLGIIDNIQNDRRFRVVDGWFCDTLTKALQAEIAAIGELIFVNIDVDIHKSTIELLDFVKPMLRPGTVLYFDDWKDPSDVPAAGPERKWGEHLAWEQWSAANPNIKTETLFVNPLNQRYMKVTAI